MPKRRKSGGKDPDDVAGPSHPSSLQRQQQPTKNASDSEDHDSDDSIGDSSYSGNNDSDSARHSHDSQGTVDRVEVHFRFNTPAENDFHGMKVILSNYLDGRQWACSELVDAIIEAPSGSTIIKCGEEEKEDEEEQEDEEEAGCIGVAAVLPIHDHLKSQFITDIRDFLVSKCPDENAKTKVTNALMGASSAGPASSVWALLVNERLLNAPPQLSPPLMQGILDEVEEFEESRRPSMYLFLTRAYVDAGSLPVHGNTQTDNQAHKASKGKKRRKKSKEDVNNESQKKHHASDPQDMIFVTPEGEFFCQAASWAMAFDIEDRPMERDELKPKRVLMAISAEKMKDALQNMIDVISAAD